MARISRYIASMAVFSMLLVLMLSPVADAQLKIKFAPKDKGLLFETQVYGIEVPGVPVHFEEGEILFTKDINNNMIKPSIMYRPKGVDIEGIEFGIIVFNYFHEFMMAFPACEAEPVRDGTHGKWVNIRPWGQFVHFSFDYFDSSIKIGLTATPKETEYVSNITYFGEPVYTYSLKQGIEDGFLAPYKVVRIDIDKDVLGWTPPQYRAS